MGNYEFRNRIRAQRAIKNVTQAELAEKIGVTRNPGGSGLVLLSVESPILAIRLARFFEIKVEELFELSEK